MKKNVKKLGALLLAGAMAVSTVGCMPTSKPQESTGEQNAQASDATQGTEEPAAPEGLEVDTQTPITCSRCDAVRLELGVHLLTKRGQLL